MQKTLVVLTACMLAFGVAACGNDTTKETETDETTTTVETTVESEVEATEAKYKDSKSHEEIPGDKDSDVKDDGTIDTIKDILEEDKHYYDENGEANSPRDQHTNEHGDVVKPSESSHSKVDGYKDEFNREKEPSTDVTEEVLEYVFDNAEDNTKPDVPRKLVTEE